MASRDCVLGAKYECLDPPQRLFQLFIQTFADLLPSFLFSVSFFLLMAKAQLFAIYQKIQVNYLEVFKSKYIWFGKESLS